jgi:hypothetical protein
MSRRLLFLVVPCIALALVGGALIAWAERKGDGQAGGEMTFVPVEGSGGTAQPLAAVGSGFTFQGRLKQSGSLANGSYDLAYSLYDALSSGSQVGATITQTGQTVSDGLFTAQLDFGAAAFLGEARWLQIAVRQTGGGGFTTLTPRQPVSPAPYSLSAPWQGIGGKPAEYNPLRFANITQTLETAGNTGQYTSATIGADGLGLISYYDFTSGDLRVAHCNNPACTSASTTPIDTSGDVGQSTAIIIGADGLGLISYYNATSLDLRVAHCNNVACTSAITSTLDFTGSVGFYSSVTIGTDGLGLISYQDNVNADLKVAHCINTNCSGATLSTLDSAGGVGQFTSVAVGTDGLGLISYNDTTNGDLKVAHCSNVACTTATLATLDGSNSVGQDTSLAIGADGLGLISYYDKTAFDLKVAHCSNVTCTTATLVTPDTTGDVGEFTSLTIGPDGLGLVSYWDGTNGDLKVMHCNNPTCSSFSLGMLDGGASSLGLYTSLTIGPDGLGLISYHDQTNGDLKVAHCGSPACVPYLRRR